MDRNLGAHDLKNELVLNGLDVTVHDTLFAQQERDPWIFYWAGKNDYVLVTADLDFKRLFTHQAAITLGRTAVLSFTGSTYNSEIRAKAFLKAKSKIFRILKNQPRPFIATIWLGGEIHLDNPNPSPNRNRVDRKDWESYERVCKAEGIDPETGAPVPLPAKIQRSDS